MNHAALMREMQPGQHLDPPVRVGEPDLPQLGVRQGPLGRLGRQVVRDGALLTMDTDELRRTAAAWQLRIASGEPLRLAQPLLCGDRAAIRGHAVEVRIVAAGQPGIAAASLP